jgi:hypothetical protein
MRFLSLRLKPKAAAAPRAGRGPGTGAADEVKGVDRVQTAPIGTSVLVKKGCPVVGLKTRPPVPGSGFHNILDIILGFIPVKFTVLMPALMYPRQLIPPKGCLG